MTAGPPWLAWVREVHALAQAGITYAPTPYDRDRYERLRTLAADMTAALADVDPAPVRLLFGTEAGYLTPKLDVRAAVADADGRLLLVREIEDGGWTMPGGWADVGESIAEGAVREVAEESGYVVRAERLLGLYERERWGHPRLPFFTLKAVVAARLLGGSASTSSETDGVGWFAADELPPLSVGRCSPELLRRVFEHLADPTLPTDLD